MLAGYLVGILAMTFYVSIWGRFLKLDEFLLFSIFVGLTVLAVWLFFFLPIYSLSKKTDFIWRWPWNIAIGALSGALFMGAIWWGMAKRLPVILLIPILIMSIAFLCGSYFKRKYEHTDPTLHPRLGRRFLILVLLLLLVTNMLHARYLDEARQETRRVFWSYLPPSAANRTENRVMFRSRHDDFITTRPCSPKLRQYLDSLDSEEVAITFGGTYNYGKRRGRGFLEVDGLREWEASLEEVKRKHL